VTRWRLVVAVALAAVVAAPLGLPAGQLLTEPDAWRAWSDASRLLALARNTSYLIGGTLALCLPAGVLGAILLSRTDLHFRRPLRALVLLTLFVPLPLFTSGWQAAVGSGGWLPLRWWNAPRPSDAAFASSDNAWTPWGQGIGTAIWIHAVAGLPWVVWLVGRGLRQVDRELEEDALTAAAPWRVLTRVSLPRAFSSIAAAALWVALQTATEITVTDVMQVRTYAEEVYTQFVLSDRGSLARAVAVSLPLTVVVTMLVLAAVERWEVTLSSSSTRIAAPLTYHLGVCGWPASVAIAGVAVTLAGVPSGSLIWRAGLSGTPLSWSAKEVLRNLLLATKSSMTLVAGHPTSLLAISLLVALAAGAVAATLALLTCWGARDSSLFRIAVVVLMAAAWATPGPIVGLGLLALMNRLLDWTGPGMLADQLWYGPSFAPVIWADVVRIFPCAVAVLWPAVRTLPVELREAARVEGAGPLRELVAVVVPLTAGMWLLAALSTAVLALGEVSASKIVATPGGETWVHGVFTQMHYGVTADLAARCLLLLLVASTAITVLGLIRWLTSRSESSRD
jgi:iron(III) transport system permease protein